MKRPTSTKRTSPEIADAEFRAEVLASLREIVDLLTELGTHRAKEYHDVREAAAYIGVSPEQLRGFCQLDGLRHARMTGKQQSHIRLKREWLDEWMAQREVVQKF